MDIEAVARLAAGALLAQEVAERINAGAPLSVAFDALVAILRNDGELTGPAARGFVQELAKQARRAG
ncbi:hypothetical protein [Piscinibacter defluvii]|uniref:hypothetical protein n=1 Tax=Piscinibacter defluvii TaxID=1796922 RepID=UPI000FDF21E5|nr:hypothetical protein [Piscinibacter defluvii]